MSGVTFVLCILVTIGGGSGFSFSDGAPSFSSSGTPAPAVPLTTSVPSSYLAPQPRTPPHSLHASSDDDPPTTSVSASVSVEDSSTQQHAPDELPVPLPRHHHHKHKPRPPPSPFSDRGLDVINRCTLAVQSKSRGKLSQWSDEFLIKPLALTKLKPEVLNSPHKIGGLYCRAGIWFEMLNEDAVPSSEENWLEPYRIRGTRNVESRYALMEFYSIAVGVISIRGLESKEFVCMNRKGDLYTAPIENYTTECLFKEEVLENYYNSYASCAYGTPERQWHLALRRSGAPRRGRRIASYDIGAQFLVKELNKDFWVEPQVQEPTHSKSLSGFDDDGFNWLEKMTNSWQDLTKKKKEPQPSLMGIRNIDNELLGKYYDNIPTKRSGIVDGSVGRSQSTGTRNQTSVPLKTNQQFTNVHKQTREELTQYMERKRRRMEREERRRRHRRKELEQLRKYPTSHRLRSLARYNHSQMLSHRLRHISHELKAASSTAMP